MKLLKQTCFKMGICLPIWFFIFHVLGFRTGFVGTFVIGAMSFLCIDMIMWGYKGFLAHKGNCKFCAERRKQELKELIKELKK